MLDVALYSPLLSDIYAWQCSKKGHYSVKSSYQFIRFFKGLKNDKPRSSNLYTLWKKIYCLNLTLKIRMFFWRLCAKALPTSKGIHRRVESICPYVRDVVWNKRMKFMLYGTVILGFIYSFLFFQYCSVWWCFRLGGMVFQFFRKERWHSMQ